MILDVFSGDGDDSEIDTMSDEEEDVNNEIATECLKRKKELLELMTECGEERMQIWKTLMLKMTVNENEPEITMQEVLVKDNNCFLEVDEMVEGTIVSLKRQTKWLWRTRSSFSRSGRGSCQEGE